MERRSAAVSCNAKNKAEKSITIKITQKANGIADNLEILDAIVASTTCEVDALMASRPSASGRLETPRAGTRSTATHSGKRGAIDFNAYSANSEISVEDGMTPSTLCDNHLRKLEDICTKMAKERNTPGPRATGSCVSPAQEYMFIYNSEFEMRNDGRFVMLKENQINKDGYINSTTTDRDEKGLAPEYRREPLISSRSISFADARKAFEP